MTLNHRQQLSDLAGYLVESQLRFGIQIQGSVAGTYRSDKKMQPRAGDLGKVDGLGLPR
ncbi:hypothetical protein ACL7TT_14380 [Microbulbifer sp. 2304DJ12-6]|uniref:hypothetical protein n=1 Tax=Microbulbifer sp. 2304DJ12-6 TaxID=3233340 RepID=UPI0039AFF741